MLVQREQLDLTMSLKISKYLLRNLVAGTGLGRYWDCNGALDRYYLLLLDSSRGLPCFIVLCFLASQILHF